jgi:hypothetical protein
MAFGSASAMRAQAVATAYSNLSISGFAGGAVNYTGLELAKNADVVAGVDIGFRPFKGFFPALEGRGLYPILKGKLVNEDNLLAGVRVGRRKDRFNPYGDVLFGRGRLKFPDGYPDPTKRFTILSNTTNVISFGGGLDYMLYTHWGAKADFQMQRYGTPVAVNGSLFSKVFTLGVVYHLGSGGVSGLRGRRW